MTNEKGKPKLSLDDWSDEKLIEGFNNVMRVTVPNIGNATIYMIELNNRGMRHISKNMNRLTWVIAILTGLSFLCMVYATFFFKK